MMSLRYANKEINDINDQIGTIDPTSLLALCPFFHELNSLGFNKTPIATYTVRVPSICTKGVRLRLSRNGTGTPALSGDVVSYTCSQEPSY